MTLSVLVLEGESVMRTCRPHADWLRSYSAEDAAVRLVDEMRVDEMREEEMREEA